MGGFFDPLLAFLDATVEERFVKPEHRSMLLVSDNVTKLLESLVRYEPPRIEKWLALPES